MPARARDFYDVAKYLATNQTIQGEGPHRTACSRAYYAVYLAYRDAIRVQESDPTFDFNHESFIAALNSPRQSPEIKKLAVQARALKEWRVTSDYDQPHSIVVGDNDADERVDDSDAALTNIAALVSARRALPIPARR